MRIINVFLIFAAGLVSPTHLFSGWTKVSLGASVNLRDVAFPDPSNGWIVGFNGLILHTTDGGASWNPQSSGVTSALYTVSFSDALHGIIGGGGGTRLRTTDGGATWVSVPGFIFSGFTTSSMVDADNGWLAGSAIDLDLLAPVGYILRTTDGGAAWDGWAVYADSTDVWDIQFVNPDRGWAVRGFIPGDLLRSTNGGANWSLLKRDSSEQLSCVEFFDTQNGVMVSHHGSSSLLTTTTDGGTSWSAGLAIPGALVPYDLDFVDPMKGRVVGQGPWIERTTDGGSTWEQESTKTTATLRSISYLSDSVAWIVGDGGTVLRYDPGVATTVDEPTVPTGFALLQNYPNPFNPETRIRFTLSRTERVTISVTDVLGREVARPLDGVREPGSGEVSFEGTGLAGGVYYATMRAGASCERIKMLLVR